MGYKEEDQFNDAVQTDHSSFISFSMFTSDHY